MDKNNLKTCASHPTSEECGFSRRTLIIFLFISFVILAGLFCIDRSILLDANKHTDTLLLNCKERLSGNEIDLWFCRADSKEITKELNFYKECSDKQGYIKQYNGSNHLFYFRACSSDFSDISITNSTIYNVEVEKP
jgi:hypothetical protein